MKTWLSAFWTITSDVDMAFTKSTLGFYIELESIMCG